MTPKFPVRKWKNIAIISLGMIATSTLTFNCAPSLFVAESSVVASSTAPELFDEYANAGQSPIALMSVNETFASIVNVTGLNNMVPDALRAEFAVRAGAMADTPLVTNLSAPLQLAATALAGEACSAVIDRERAAGANRVFFRGVDFTKGPADQTPAAFNDAVTTLSNAFWNRPPTAEERTLLENFRTDVPVSALATQTRGIYLGVCTAMLASFDAITY